MENKKFLVGAFVVVLALGLYGAFRPAKTETIVDRVETKVVGAQSGPDDTGPYHCLNGLCTYSYSSVFGNLGATSTACSFITPSATSTLTFGSANISTPTTTAIQIEIGKSSFPAATTTRLGLANVASGGYATLLASTTPRDQSLSMVNPDWVFAPSSYYTVKIGGVSLGNALKGTCKAEFQVN